MNRATTLVVVLPVALVVTALSLGGKPWHWWLALLWDVMYTVLEWIMILLVALLWTLLLLLRVW